jgi:hypothetical protein
MRLPKPERTTVFISYSHRDEEWLRRVQIHLRDLERRGLIQLWDDTKIPAGDRWRENISDALNLAKVAILLVSADFIASEFIANDELPLLLAKAKNEGAVILPLILSPSCYEEREDLSQFQAINDPSKPFIGLEKVEQEDCLVKLRNAVFNAIKQVSESERTLERQDSGKVPDHATFQTEKVEECSSSRSASLIPPGDWIPIKRRPYVERKGERKVLNYLMNDHSPVPIWIKGRRKSGKTSLLLRMLECAKATHKTVHIPFESVFPVNVQISEEAFCQHLTQEITSQLMPENLSHGAGRPTLVPHLEKLFKSALYACSSPIILGFDDLDAGFGSPYFQSFLGVIRSCHIERSKNSIWDKLSFAATMSLDDSVLVRQGTTSPFDFGIKIDLKEFSIEESRELARQVGMSDADKFIVDLHSFVGGHPYLLHKLLCEVKEGASAEEVKADACRRVGIFREHLDYVLRELSQQSEVNLAFCKLPIGEGKSIELDDEIGQRLWKLGLASNPRGKRWNLTCLLYREFQAELQEEADHGKSI